MDQNSLTDIEILEWNAGGQFIKDMSAISFVGWIATKINGVTSNDIIRELATAVANPPMMSRMANESKIRYVRLLIKAGVTI